MPPPQMSHEFTALQLALVDRFVELGLGSVAEGVHRLTNLQRRLGLGPPTDPISGSAWIGLVEQLQAERSHDNRVGLVMTEFERLPPAVPEHIAHDWPTVGAFSAQIVGSTLRTHFFSMDTDDRSPLHPDKLGQRRDELRTVLADVYSGNPQLTHVAGGSWMYTTASYASLFPAAHIENARARRGRQTFRGMSHWGQFLDHRWQIRPNLAEEFRRRIARWEGDDPSALFPIPTLEVRSPIEVFDLDDPASAERSGR